MVASSHSSPHDHRPDFDSIVVYEPGVPINGSFDLSFRAEFRRLLERGKHVRAMALFLHRTRLLPLPWSPYPVCWALSLLMVGRASEMRDLMPTTPKELDEVARADSDGSAFAAIMANTLLLSGSASPRYLTETLDTLSAIIPRATHRTIPGANHNTPDESDPPRIAAELRSFLSA